ncbi:MAG TPA: phytoene desaturase family protein [Mycobacteriales bacterium]|nr:phytoene desaturase family protein [Mycobacteriales bacterium]
MRTVSGRTDRIVVVGAGLAGLSAALRLAGAGREVTIVERDDGPGGRAGRLELTAPDGGTYRFDTGPTVLTMPDLIADALDCVGERMEDWLELEPVTPLYRARFADGSSIDVLSDVDAMAENIRTVCGPQDADGYRRYVGFVSELYRAEMRTFIDRNIDSPLGLLTPDLLTLVRLGAFRRLAPKVASYLRDPRLQRVLSFQAMYAGLSPYDALAIYAVISYMDSVAGVFFPKGGLHAVPLALAGAAEKAGVQLRYGTTVARVLVEGGRARGVVTDDGERVDADAVVLTADLPVAWRELLGTTPRRVARQRYSPSCFLLLAGARTTREDQAHHTIHFGDAWKQTFAELIDRGQLMSDPSLLVTTPSVTDPALAPAGRSVHYVLAPTPNLRAGIDWRSAGPRYRDELVGRLERLGYDGLGAAIEVEHTTTPLDWAERGLEAGAPFAAAHTFGQTGPFRAPNLPRRGPDGVVFAGSGTVPGVGVPMVLLSGRLAAERITGPDRGYRSRAY